MWAVTGWSYTVEVDGKLLHHNRQYLKPSLNAPVGEERAKQAAPSDEEAIPHLVTILEGSQIWQGKSPYPKVQSSKCNSNSEAIKSTKNSNAIIPRTSDICHRKKAEPYKNLKVRVHVHVYVHESAFVVSDAVQCSNQC